MPSLSKQRLQKLKSMTLAELRSRASYAAFVAVERRRLKAGRLHSAPRELRMVAWRELIQARRVHGGPRFFEGLRHREEMRSLFGAEGPYAEQAAKARDAAAAAIRHEFEFFGQRFTYGPKIDWHADPATHRRWPVVFHRDVPQIADTIGDIKYVWELNRHQFLIDLGKAYWLFDDTTAASAAYRLLRSWIAANPYGTGVSWSCALEPAFRVWSWLWTYQFCADDPALDIETHAMWLDSLSEHGAFLHRHLEYYSSPYNHLVGEAAALYALGVLFPEMPAASKWRRRGRRVLESKIDSEFHADGGSVEQSTFYHHATLGFYLLAVLLGDANGEPFPAHVHAAIERAIAFSMAMIQPDGRVPSIGGADDGKSIRLEHLPFWDFRAFQAIGAVRYTRGDFRFAAGEFFEDALWLLGPQGRRRFQAIGPAEPPSSKAFPASGYYLVRSGWSPQSDYLCFDCGEQAAGLRRDSVPSAAHGHADCLSVILWLRGRPVLVDPGFYCYNGDPAWEVHFRRTAAHSTASVDRRDQSRHIAKMAWSHAFTPSPEAWLPNFGHGAAGGSHDGYARGTAGVIHRRAVWLHPIGGCIIVDQFTGTGTHEIEINYQFAAGGAELSGDGVLLFDHAEVTWTGSTPVQPEVRRGGDGPEDGWVAPSLGVKTAAPRLSLSSTFREPAATYMTLILPRAAADRSRTLRDASSVNKLAIGVRNTDGTVQWLGVPLAGTARSAKDLIASLTTWNAMDDSLTLSAPAVEVRA